MSQPAFRSGSSLTFLLVGLALLVSSLSAQNWPSTANGEWLRGRLG